MTKTRNIVQTVSGLYVEEWTHTPTSFDMSLTDNIFRAISVTLDNFKSHFEPRKCTYLTVEITAKIL